MKSALSFSRRNRERGAATLVVVMVLFFIISMVAAYTSRNLIFEQRTSANQYRSTQAQEAAEAGLADRACQQPVGCARARLKAFGKAQRCVFDVGLGEAAG